jgi:hypothetical protein
MRRAFLMAVLALLMADASGVSSLLIPETCAIGTTESAPDGGCPGFCVRCTCGCCASAVVHTVPLNIVARDVPPVPFTVLSDHRLPAGAARDILHVPKPLLT